MSLWTIRKSLGHIKGIINNLYDIRGAMTPLMFLPYSVVSGLDGLTGCTLGFSIVPWNFLILSRARTLGRSGENWNSISAGNSIFAINRLENEEWYAIGAEYILNFQ